MSEEKKFQSVKRGKKKCKCRILGVRKKNERKVPEKKSKCLQMEIKVEVEKKKNQGFLFTGFVPTGWAPCCERTKSWVPCCERIKSYLRRWASCSK